MARGDEGRHGGAEICCALLSMCGRSFGRATGWLCAPSGRGRHSKPSAACAVALRWGKVHGVLGVSRVIERRASVVQRQQQQQQRFLALRFFLLRSQLCFKGEARTHHHLLLRRPARWHSPCEAAGQASDCARNQSRRDMRLHRQRLRKRAALTGHVHCHLVVWRLSATCLGAARVAAAALRARVLRILLWRLRRRSLVGRRRALLLCRHRALRRPGHGGKTNTWQDTFVGVQ